MRRTHWWIAAALAATVGCTAETTTPNEAGSAAPSAPAPTSPTGTPSGAMAPKLGSESMPSNYPGMEKLKKEAAKEESTPPKADDEPKTPSKPEKDAAPKS